MCGGGTAAGRSSVLLARCPANVTRLGATGGLAGGGDRERCGARLPPAGDELGGVAAGPETGPRLSAGLRERTVEGRRERWVLGGDGDIVNDASEDAGDGGRPAAAGWSPRKL